MKKTQEEMGVKKNGDVYMICTECRLTKCGTAYTWKKTFDPDTHSKCGRCKVAKPHDTYAVYKSGKRKKACDRCLLIKRADDKKYRAKGYVPNPRKPMTPQQKHASMMRTTELKKLWARQYRAKKLALRE